MPEDSANPFGGLDLLSSAVLLLDERSGNPHLNPAAENLLEISHTVFSGCRLDSVIECPAEAAGGARQRSPARLELHRAEHGAATGRWQRAAA
jgi:nitrogen-specific signal transduction histidine kinase